MVTSVLLIVTGVLVTVGAISLTASKPFNRRFLVVSDKLPCSLLNF
jgi:hypothetical protein